MPNFVYRAKKANAETQEGQIVAMTREEAVEKINQMGLIPVTVEESSGSAAKRRSSTVLKGGKVKSKELYLFSRQLVNLLKSRVPILRALELVGSQIKNDYFRGIVDGIRASVRGGRSFSDCLAEYPQIFSHLYVTMVKAGEEGGSLHVTLGDVAGYLQRQNELSSKVKTAMAYPLLMMMVGMGTVYFILTKVMPKIAGLFSNLNQSLPMATIIVMKVSKFLIDWSWGIFVGLIVIIFSFRKWAQSNAGKTSLSQIQLGLPFFGQFILAVEMARFCQTLSLLLKSGVPIVRALKLSAPVVGNELIQNQLFKCQEELLAGRSLGQSLKEASLIPEIVGHVVAIGEESGSLETILNDLAENYDTETNETMKVMTTLLEPLMILVIGSLVGFIVIAMLLPIFQINAMTN